jgi:hypothetical protein
MRRDEASSTVVLPPSAECEKPASMDATPLVRVSRRQLQGCQCARRIRLRKQN